MKLKTRQGSKSESEMTRLPLTERNIETLLGELSGDTNVESDGDGGDDVAYEEERERRRKREEMVARRARRKAGIARWLEGVS